MLYCYTYHDVITVLLNDDIAIDTIITSNSDHYNFFLSFTDSNNTLDQHHTTVLQTHLTVILVCTSLKLVNRVFAVKQ